jgi:hypothetical protein
MVGPRSAKLLTVVLLLGSCSPGITGGVRAQVNLLLPGDHFARRAWPPSGQTWLGLYREPAGYVLRQVRVFVEPSPDTQVAAATRVRAQDGPHPMMFLQGPALRAGQVDTAYTGRRFLYPGEILSFQFGAQWYSVRAFGRALRRGSEAIFQDYELVLQLNAGAQTVTQTIYRDSLLTLDNPPYLLWVGDLNRDRRPDLYFSLPGGGYSELYTLMLSVTDSRRLLVRPVAAFLELDL